MLNQQRELAAVLNKQADAPPWLTLQQLHHTTALVRAAGIARGSAACERGRDAPLPAAGARA